MTFWPYFQPERGLCGLDAQCDYAKYFAEFEFWCAFRPEHGVVQLPSGLQCLTFGYDFTQSMDSETSSSGLWSLTLCLAGEFVKFLFGVHAYMSPIGYLFVGQRLVTASDLARLLRGLGHDWYFHVVGPACCPLGLPSCP